MIPPPEELPTVTMASPEPPPYQTSVAGKPSRPDIGEAIEKEPIIQVLLDVFDGEVLNR